MVVQSRHSTKDMSITIPGSLEFVLKSAQDQYHVSLLELSKSSPVMMIFLRYFGSCFCREALADIHTAIPEIENSGVKIVLVHMASDEEASTLFASYGLADLSRISASDQGLYKAFGLARASIKQLASVKFWLRGLEALSNGHPMGRLIGDSLQLPGVFLIEKGKITKSFRHQSAGDRPNYLDLAREATEAFTISKK